MTLRESCIQFFTKFIHDIGCTVDEDGTIRHYHLTKDGGVKYPKLKIGDLDVVMPLKEQLALSEGTNIIYAPLNENALAGESAVLTATKKLINTTLQHRTNVVLIVLGTILANKMPVKGKLLTLLKSVPEFDATTQTELKRLLKRAANVPLSRNIVGIYLAHKNQQFEGRPVKRLATVVSPLVSALTDDPKPWDVKMAKVHAGAIKALVEAVLPDIQIDGYTAGSNNPSAPYFHALGTAFGNISTRLAYVENLIAPYMDAATLATMPARVKGDWIETMADFSHLSKAFPPLQGNNGNVPVGKEVSTNLTNIKVDEANAPSNGFGQPTSAAPKPTGGSSWEPAPQPQSGFGVPAVTPFGVAPTTSGGFGQPASGFGAPQQQSGFGAASSSTNWG